jgi:hypothetical protein
MKVQALYTISLLVGITLISSVGLSLNPVPGPSFTCTDGTKTATIVQKKYDGYLHYVEVQLRGFDQLRGVPIVLEVNFLIDEFFPSRRHSQVQVEASKFSISAEPEATDHAALRKAVNYTQLGGIFQATMTSTFKNSFQLQGHLAVTGYTDIDHKVFDPRSKMIHQFDLNCTKTVTKGND